MSVAVSPHADPNATSASTTLMRLEYTGASSVLNRVEQTRIQLVGNCRRQPVRFHATIRDPLAFREALATLHAIIGSDYRYVPRSRSDYLAYLQLKSQIAPLRIWQAQQAYYEWLLQNDPASSRLPDPLVTVHPDRIFWEVFAKDESIYACLAFPRAAFQQSDAEAADTVCGTTNIDYSDTFATGLQQIRSYRTTRLELDVETADDAEISSSPAPQGQTLTKQLQISDSWLRGFLQVQAAATLPCENCCMASIDLYNVLRHLRLHGDLKGQRRGLRFDLIPGERPRIVLEPWNTVITTALAPFQGRSSQRIRVWGRRRLMAVKRLLPFLERLDVYLLGSGLPSFWVFHCSNFTLTIGLTGLTNANWSAALGFDLLLPRLAESLPTTDTVVQTLAGGLWSATRQTLANETNIKGTALLKALQAGCQSGLLMYDLAEKVYRYRPLSDAPLDLSKLQYRNDREKIAHDLVLRRKAVKIVSEKRLPSVGLELIGQVSVREDKRDYRPQMVLIDEGGVRRVNCTCSAFRQQGIQGGPCVHLMALRLAYAVKLAQRATQDDAIAFETRTLVREVSNKEQTVQISLERNRIKYRWGQNDQSLRLQTLRFNTEDEARRAYLLKLAELDAQGFYDTVTD